MKVIASMCKGGANQRKDKDDTVILSRGSCACQHTSPRCVDRSLGGSVANWHHSPSPHVGYWHFLVQSLSVEVLRPSSVIVPEMPIDIS